VTKVHVLRVFTDTGGNHGNPLGVVLDTAGLDDIRRQAIAAELGFSETVFVEDVAKAELRIFTPALELPLAGHPLVGTAWLLSQVTGSETRTLVPLRASEAVHTWWEDGLTWVRARVDDAPPWLFARLDAPEEVEALPFPPRPDQDGREYWAWQDEAAGILRARFFAPSYGVPEDEATGSAALRLVSQLGRPIVIHQGRGSVIHARPAIDAAYAEIGGRVVEDEARTV
jgi:predicted PhzF superfamily epimerase YddE/YHI9